MRLSRTGLLLVLLALGVAVPSSASAALNIHYSGQLGYTNETRPLIQGTAWTDPGDDTSLTLEVGQPAMTTGFTATVDVTGDTWSYRPVDPLAEGTYEVTATQWHAGSASIRHQALYIDLTPPPAPLITLNSTSATADGTPIVTSRFLATFATPSETKPRYECAIDAASPIACSKVALHTFSGEQFTVAPGEHVLGVRAIDQAGNTGPLTSQRLVVPVDTTKQFGLATSSANVDLGGAKRIRVSSSGHFKIPVRNRNGFAVGAQFAVTTITRLKARRGSRVVRVTKQLALRTRTLVPLSASSVDIALSRSGRRRLRTSHKLRVRLTVNVFDAGGTVRVVTAATTLVS